MIAYIVGPTAVGKTAHAVRLAAESGGEVITLDSRQWYRGMDIGTAKPTAAERHGVPHHLIDISPPDQTVSLAAALELARAAVAEVVGRGATAILCGGTGQYVRALREGWVVPAVAPDPDFRRLCEDEARLAGAGALHRRLGAVDPIAAAKIGPDNVRRLIRALEVHRATGEPISTWQVRRTAAISGQVIRLERPRAELYAAIEARVDAMLGQGLEEEVRGLLDAGYGFDLPAMSGVGYLEWRACFDGSAGIGEVRASIISNTKRLVRKQDTWFRADDPSVQQVEPSSGASGPIDRAGESDHTSASTPEA